jgi:hypothetical protein
VSGAVDRGLFSSRRNSVTAVVNQEIVLNSDGAALVEIAAETIPRRLAWRDNMLAFDGETPERSHRAGLTTDGVAI